jgi:hypothetical protein
MSLCWSSIALLTLPALLLTLLPSVDAACVWRVTTLAGNSSSTPFADGQGTPLPSQALWPSARWLRPQPSLPPPALALCCPP